MEEFDYLVLGGGSRRLRRRKPAEREFERLGCAGRGRQRRPRMDDPDTARGPPRLVPSKLNNWAYNTIPQSGLADRVGYQPRGKALGGSSAINAMVYIRGHRSDYDEWAARGNVGWSYDDVPALFQEIRE